MQSTRLVLALAAFTVTMHAARADDESCRKNHYILSDTPCAPVTAPEISIGRPGAIAVDRSGNVIFSGMHAVFRLSPDGHVARIAGNGTPGFAGDGGRALDAVLNIPFDTYPEIVRDPTDWAPLVGGLAVDAAGNVLVADSYNDRVRRIDLAGMISTVAGGAPGEALLGGRLRQTQGVAVDPDGTMYVSDGFGPLWRVSPGGTGGLMAESNCGPPWRWPGLCAPQLIAAGGDGSVYAPDVYCRIRKVSQAGVTTIAGNEAPSRGMPWTCGYAGENAPAIGAALSYPMGVALDRSGNLYIADTENNCIRKVDAAGVIASFAGRCGSSRYRGFSGDGGPAVEASLDRPFAVAADDAGNVYISDTYNGRIRKVTADGTITTVAGNGEALEVQP